MERLELNTTLFFNQGSADKVYIVKIDSQENLEGWTVNFAHGRRGKPLKTGTKTPKPVSYGDALKIYSKLIHTKEQKGYIHGSTAAAPVVDPLAGERTTWLPQLLNEVTLEEAIEAYKTWGSTYVQTKHDGERRGILLGKDGVVPANRRGLRTSVAPEIQTALEDIWGKNLLLDVNMGVLDTEDMGDHLAIFD